VKPKDRLVLALALSIALHEVVAGLIPPGFAHSPTSREVVTQAAILHVAIRRIPTPMPSPQLKANAAQLRPVVPRLGAHRAGLANRATLRVAGRTSALQRVHVVEAPASKPVSYAASAATGSGARLAAAGGGGNASAGAPAGNGTAATSADPPCGFVTFSDPHGSQYDARTRGFWVDIRMAVRFADGTSQSLILDYPWYYSSEAANPWSDQNLKDPGFPTRFQAPPPEKLASEPALVQYVMHHSTPGGLTLLGDCPTASPATETP
jgi:hypothetical protein